MFPVGRKRGLGGQESVERVCEAHGEGPLPCLSMVRIRQQQGLRLLSDID